MRLPNPILAWNLRIYLSEIIKKENDSPQTNTAKTYFALSSPSPVSPLHRAFFLSFFISINKVHPVFEYILKKTGHDS